MLTLTKIKSYVQTMVVDSTITAGYDSERIANDAGITLYDLHPWRFREGASQNVNLVADQAYVDLPADLGAITAWALSDNRKLTWTTPEDLALWRNQSRSRSGFLAAISQPAQANQTSALPAWRLELFPTPSDDPGTLTLWYRREWPTLSDDAHVAAIPPYCEPLYLQIVSAFVQGAWVGNQDTLSPRLSEIQRSALFKQAINADGYVQPNFGPMRNGQAQTAYYDEFPSAQLEYTG